MNPTTIIAAAGWALAFYLFFYFVLAPLLIMKMGWHEQVIEVETDWPNSHTDLSYRRPTLMDLWHTRVSGNRRRQHVRYIRPRGESGRRIVLTRITIKDPATRRRYLAAKELKG